MDLDSKLEIYLDSKEFLDLECDYQNGKITFESFITQICITILSNPLDHFERIKALKEAEEAKEAELKAKWLKSDRSAPLVIGAMGQTASYQLSGRRGREEASVPINIIDENADGSVKVTRIGKKGDIEND